MCFSVFAAPARANVVVRPAAVPQMQTGPEALAAQMAQYKSTISSTTSSPTAEQGTARSDVSQPELQQFPGGIVMFQPCNIFLMLRSHNLDITGPNMLWPGAIL